ncbi:caspase family protein [Parasphingorhabdus halotolerans]|uniref:caspase family protein n=1 Tax=Parasphingorhabdus halotolerans TaxID=2725558 RepID=UPI001B3A1B4D|nr:caspase family protein [Parasphingorhabdus halotolerans]
MTGDRGVALLIGIGAYDDLNWPALPNAVNDIDHVCVAFAKAGFEIIDVRNASIAELNSATELFEAKASAANSAVVYYAGHGFEYNGRNFMVPVDAPLFASKEQLDSHFLPLDKLLKAASQAKRFNLFFMDACRTPDPIVRLKDVNSDDPEGNVSPMGLLEMTQGAVFYSTAKGRPALDAAPVDSKTSPFAKAIATKLAIPGLELSDYFKVVSREVYANTRELELGPQQPFHYGSWFEDFYLNPPQKPATGLNATDPSSKAGGRASIGAEAGAYLPAIATKALSSIQISMDRLAIEDETILIGEVLSNHGVADLTLLAVNGDALAQSLLGYMYHLGVGVSADLKQAREWLEKSAEQGHPAGQTELAWFLQENDPAETARSLELYQLAAAQGYAKAQSHLGFALWEGKLGLTDKKRALELFAAASDRGHPYATYALGIYGGQVEEAVRKLRVLADTGNVEGNNWICELRYQFGQAATVAKDCSLAARGGYAGARAIWAQLHDRGQGIPKSPSEARYWAKLATSQAELKLRPDLERATSNILSRD